MRPEQITFTNLWENHDLQGRPYYTGQLGPTRVIVAPVKNPVPGRGTYALIFAESRNTVPAQIDMPMVERQGGPR